MDMVHVLLHKLGVVLNFIHDFLIHIFPFHVFVLTTVKNLPEQMLRMWFKLALKPVGESFHLGLCLDDNRVKRLGRYFSFFRFDNLAFFIQLWRVSLV